MARKHAEVRPELRSDQVAARSRPQVILPALISVEGAAFAVLTGLDGSAAWRAARVLAVIVMTVLAGAVPDEPIAARWFQAVSPGTVQVWTVARAGHTGALTAQPQAWEARVTSFLNAALNPATVAAVPG